MSKFKKYYITAASDSKTVIANLEQVINGLFGDQDLAVKTCYSAHTGKTFAVAITALKAGMRVARQGWNGKGMYVFLKKGGPEAGGFLQRPYLVIKNVDETLASWVPSSTDLMAEDWQIIGEFDSETNTPVATTKTNKLNCYLDVTIERNNSFICAKRSTTPPTDLASLLEQLEEEDDTPCCPPRM